ncbi:MULTISPECIES: DUF6345 domain-containing protein [unclassified Rhodococcus (in: high G+C Gram-positive bacteria)]|uniref:DUF6345 domain-containing protein n=1 Tax=unclassified Rhodococcus (in: high G+C Gram-positive bacteria) TaxID=192944 RepID=UPI0006FACA5B|nr:MULTISPECIES: DUF6345 domain-containing protein [unclassified Rhodococcus (in: high G+C Gram-positive bacteria)]KQU36083.1 hypothetical protein ASG69_17300 [Rhodococcus sp. Leaf225]KQU48631.1 hypothetical protein ASH03_01775 [Rhodococcus sp. Leaf258]
MTTITPPGTTGSDRTASPFEAARATGVHGASSIQTFMPGVGGLSRTHGDADGFAAYLNRFSPGNFRFRDSGVQFWQYAEPYDDWQGVYGSDAVSVFYHSGHGTMDGAGVFYAPLGAAWGGKDWIRSDEITWGNERLRYAFWSTCLSLRVHGGHSPWRTWAAHAAGMRMLFGWETVSWDVDVYGRRFWDHWNTGQSFSAAWLNSGWDGGRDQAPSACGMGATEGEAKDRVFAERTIMTAPASSNWWWWTYYDAVRSVGAPTVGANESPAEAMSVQWDDMVSLTGALGEIGATTVHGNLARVALAHERDADRRASSELSAADVTVSAQSVMSALDLPGVDTEPHLVRTQRAAGARGDGSENVAPHVAGYSVEYRQIVEGSRVITPESGYVRVHLDAAGRALSADVAVRPVRSVRTTPRLAVPVAGGGGVVPTVGALLGAAASEHPDIPSDAEPIPGSREVGLIDDGNIAVRGAHEGYLVSAGHELEKKVRVSVPLDR